MKRWQVFNSLWIILVASCVTVNVYFPAAAVQKAADEIVDDVQTKGQKPEVKPDKPTSLLERLIPALGPREAHAQQINIDVSTPAIRALRASMRETFQQLKPFYEKGAVGETSAGLVEQRDTGGLSLKEKAQVNSLVDQMNRDRMSLYKEIVAANKLPPDTVPQVQKIFANSWRGKSAPGSWIQADNGAWSKK